MRHEGQCLDVKEDKESATHLGFLGLLGGLLDRLLGCLFTFVVLVF